MAKILIHILPDDNVISSGSSLAGHRLALEQHLRGLEVYTWCIRTRGEFCEIGGMCEKFKRVKIDLKRGVALFRKGAKLHFHGIWYPQYYFFYLICLLFGRSYFISIHGNLEPEALAIRAKKKFFARIVIVNRFINGATTLVAASQKERKSILESYPSKAVSVVPVGIEKLSPREEKLPSQNSKYALVLARLNESKGHGILIDAWKHVLPSELKLVIAGPDENGYRKKLEEKVKNLRLTEHIKFVGEVQGEEKDRLFRGATLFILPSLTENFGIVVIEALSYGLFVLTTTKTPWVDLSFEEGCLCVDPNPESLARGIADVMAIEKARFAAIEKKAVSTAKFYLWKNIDVFSYLRPDS
jgi:glycosyltransferase involved in cell wall biosynthesis